MNEQTKPISLADLIAEIRSKFALFGEDDFVNWLENGFQALYVDPMARLIRTEPPFGFVASFIGVRDSNLDDLQFVYRELIPLDQQPIFRRSIARLLMKDVSRPDFPEQAVSDLIYLIEKVGADESLYCLATVVGTGRYAAERGWLQYEAIAVLKQMLGSDEAVIGLYDLIASENFPSRFSFDVLGALCRYKPDRWVEHLVRMASRIGRLFDEAELRGEQALDEFRSDETEFTQLFFKTVLAPKIVRQLPILFDRLPLLPPLARFWIEDHFIRETLGKDGPLLMVPADPRFGEEEAGNVMVSLNSRQGHFVDTIELSPKQMVPMLSARIYSGMDIDLAPQLRNILPRTPEEEEALNRDFEMAG